MTIAEQLRKDLKVAIKTNDSDLKYNIRIVLGELDRISKSPKDEESLAALKKLKKLELEMLHSGGEENSSSLYSEGKITSSLLEFINSILPDQLEESEIVSWIEKNIDFSKMKNKMQAVGMVTKEFGQRVDGKMVKDIVQNKF